MKIAELKNHSIVIFGMGREGQATNEVCMRHLVTPPIMTDDRPETTPALADVIKHSDANTIVVKSPGIPPNHPALAAFQKAGAVVTSATNLFFAERKGKGTIIGVTGTKGKSTTASLLNHIFLTAKRRVALVGNIGEPAILHVDDPAETIFVIELSSYQLADLEIAPDIAIVLNLFPEHMDYHGSVEAYHEAKMHMITRQTINDQYVVDEQDPAMARWLDQVVSRHLHPAKFLDPLLERLTIKGTHNRNNGRFALAVARCLGVDDQTIADAFETFVPLPHRLEEIGPVNGILFVNDSISTTPETALAAIDVYDGRLGAMILGGHDRGYDFTELAERLSQIRLLVYVMPGGERLEAALSAVGVAFTRVEEFTEAVAGCFRNLTPGEVCLLSPGSPSYGQFKNFEHRGEVFKETIASCAASKF